MRNIVLTIKQARRKQFRVSRIKIRWSAEGTNTLGGSKGMLPREILKLSFSEKHIFSYSQRDFNENKRTET